MHDVCVFTASDIEIIEWSPLNWTCSVHVEEEVCLMCTARCASGNRLDYEWFRMDRSECSQLVWYC